MGIKLKQERLILIREHKFRSRFTQLEPTSKILRSLKKNKNQKKIKTIFNKVNLNKSKVFRPRFLIKNICMLTGRIRSYQRLFGLSRASTKIFAIKGNLQNIKTRSW